MKYPSDLTDSQWEKVKPLFAKKNNQGTHLMRHDKRTLINAVLYKSHVGCPWRALPDCFPSHSAITSFYQYAVKSGLWKEINQRLGYKPIPTRRKRYNEQFKKYAVKISYISPKSMEQIAKELGINSNLFYKWRKEYSTDKGDELLALLEDEIKSLRVEIIKLMRERDELKLSISHLRCVSEKSNKITKNLESAYKY